MLQFHKAISSLQHFVLDLFRITHSNVQSKLYFIVKLSASWEKCHERALQLEFQPEAKKYSHIIHYLVSGQLVASICYTGVSLNTSVKTFPNVCPAAENTINLLITYCISLSPFSVAPSLLSLSSSLKLLCAWPSDFRSSLFATADASCQTFWICTMYTCFLSPEWMVWLDIEEAVEHHILLNPYSSVHPKFCLLSDCPFMVILQNWLLYTNIMFSTFVLFLSSLLCCSVALLPSP